MGGCPLSTVLFPHSFGPLSWRSPLASLLASSHISYSSRNLFPNTALWLHCRTHSPLGPPWFLHDAPGHYYGAHTAGDDGGCHLHGMDSKISDLTAETISIRIDIAGFQEVEGMQQRLTTVEARFNTLPDRYQELLYLRDKLTDPEDRSHSNDVHFFGFPDCAEGTDVRAFFRVLLPNLVSLTFTSPM
ncbi:hypothetical protein NDU88_009788 [Pleurodeles waltl]|uniref:Uncharacterized protein n=1 Tax=Pleurodeles waltl TaxID=8319 RepID=A0AAV7RYP9_PLEWA|nr:hypothetical protein NDU88_009788 [Pleurodeles waltl]